MLQKAGLIVPQFIGQDGAVRPIRHVNEFWDSYGIPIHDDTKQPGDLIFFSREGSLPTHIGILRDEESYIHAPGVNESKVEVLPISYEKIARQGLKRLIYTKNPIGFKSPTVAADHPTYRHHQKQI